MSFGYIRISRELFDHPSYITAPDSHKNILMTLMYRACFKQMEIDDHGKKILLQPGQICCTIRQISIWTKSPKTTVERALKRFLSGAVLVQKAGQEAGHKKSIFTISTTYLLQEGGTETGTNSGQTRDTKEKRKKEKKDIKESVTESVASQRIDLRPILSQEGNEREIKNFIEYSQSHCLPVPTHDITIWLKKYPSPYIYEIFDLMVCDVELSKVKPGKRKIGNHLAWMQRALDKNYPKINLHAKKCMEFALHLQNNGWPNLRIRTRYASDSNTGKDFYYDNENFEFMIQREYEQIRSA